MKKFILKSPRLAVPVLAITAMFLLTACPKDSDTSSSSNGISNAVNAQGSTFARLFNADNNSPASDVNDGDAGTVTLTGLPNNFTTTSNGNVLTTP